LVKDVVTLPLGRPCRSDELELRLRDNPSVAASGLYRQ